MTHRHPLRYALSVYLLMLTVPGAMAADALWRDAPLARSNPTARSAADLPTRYRSVILDRAALDSSMQRSRHAASPQAPHTLELPLPNGGSTRFTVEASDVLPPGLASRYPSLTSMKGRDAEGRRVRLDIAPDGVHAEVRDPAGDWVVRPEAPASGARRSAARSHLVFAVPMPGELPVRRQPGSSTTPPWPRRLPAGNAARSAAA